MKKCPYCAEEIQRDAAVCRYCGRTVKGRYRRHITIIVIIAAIAVFTYTHQGDARRVLDNVGVFFTDLKDSLLALKDTLKELPRSIAAIKESQDEINNLADSMKNISVHEDK